MIIGAKKIAQLDDNLKAMADLIAQLTANGHTYVSDGSIYFKISTFPEYGKLAHFKIPKHVHVLGADEEFPMTVTGKVQKYKMRDAAVEASDRMSASAAQVASAISRLAAARRPAGTRSAAKMTAMTITCM